VTVLDPATGKREHMQVPRFATPAAARFWSHALKAIVKRLDKVGMAKSACLGIFSDSTAPTPVIEMFAKIAPGLGWMRGCHGVSRATKPYPVRGGGMVVYHEHCYGMSIPNPRTKIFSIWDQNGPPAAYFRSDFDHLPPRGFRSIAERALYQGKRGFGRMCLDYWDSPLTAGKRRGSYADVFNRWPISTCSQRRPTLMKLAGPGPDGPLSTIRYELLLEGLQEAEATMFIAEATGRRAKRLGKDLTRRCRRLLVERINVARIVNGYYGPATWDHAGWQDASRRLYETAAEVRQALRK